MTDTRCAAHPEELLRLKAEYVVPCVYHFYRNPPHITAGEGCWLIDSAGRRYLDCYAGVTVMNAGHCNPAIIEPAIQQIRTLQHTTTIYLTEPILRLAEALAQVTPGALRRSFLLRQWQRSPGGGDVAREPAHETTRHRRDDDRSARAYAMGHEPYRA